MSTRMEALIAGREAAEREIDFPALVAGSQRRVFQIAYGVVGDAADAEEIAQEVFLKAYRRIAMLRDPGRFRAWVSRIAFRLAINRQRTRRRQAARDTEWQAARNLSVVEGACDPGDRLLRDRLRREIDALPDRLRAVLLLSAVEEMEANEVAVVLGIPAGTVRSRLHAARKRLLGALSR